MELQGSSKLAYSDMTKTIMRVHACIKVYTYITQQKVGSTQLPQVIVIDEIGTELEALAARTIAEKGVQLVGTTHGNCLENLIKNPSLSDLIGGIQYVTISDEEAKRRGTQKSVLERKSYPAFQLAIEVNNTYSWTIHENVENSVDLILRGNFNISQIRSLTQNQKLKINYHIIKNDFLIKNSQLLSSALFKHHT